MSCETARRPRHWLGFMPPAVERCPPPTSPVWPPLGYRRSSATFRGRTVLATPGPLGDAAFLLGLELLDEFPPFASPIDPDYVDLSVASARLMAAERAERLGPGADSAGQQTASSAQPTWHRCARSSRLALPPRAYAGGSPEDTITLAVVDAQGNAAHLMQTVGTYFRHGGRCRQYRDFGQ